MQTGNIRDLLAGAFAAVGSTTSPSVRMKWEGHIEDAFCAFFGGEPVDDADTDETGNLLHITVGLKEVDIAMYDMGVVLHPGTDMRMFCGDAIFLHFVFGEQNDAVVNHTELSRTLSLRTGTVSIIRKMGTADEPLSVPPAPRTLQSRPYANLRRYGDRGALANGLYGAWIRLISPHEGDWDLLYAEIADLLN